MAAYRMHEAGTKRRFKWSEIIFVVVFVVICLVLLKVLFSQLALKHEVTASETVTNRLIDDIAKNDAADAHRLGSVSFQKTFPETVLQTKFGAIRDLVHGAPAIDKQIVTNDDSGQYVAIIYKYPDKPVYYIRVTASKAKGSTQWHLIGIGGDNNESNLLK